MVFFYVISGFGAASFVGQTLTLEPGKQRVKTNTGIPAEKPPH